MIYIFFIEDDEKIRTILLELNPSFVFFFPLLNLLCIICTSIFFIIFVMVMIDDFTYHMFIYIYIYGVHTTFMGGHVFQMISCMRRIKKDILDYRFLV